jgi:adenine-specific DNA-methyltransferase
MWRGKDEQDWNDLVVHAPPLYIQEKVHPKVLIDALLHQSKATQSEQEGFQPDLFSDFNYGIKFNSNFQWSTTSRDVKDGNTTHITREPEPFTWLAEIPKLGYG